MKNTSEVEHSILEIHELSFEEKQDYIVDFFLSKLSEESKDVDQFSLWLLVGTGATMSALISNLSDINEYVPINYLVLGLETMLFSIFVGMIEKFFAFSCQSNKKTKADIEGNSELLSISLKYINSFSGTKKEIISKGVSPIVKKVASQGSLFYRPVIYWSYISYYFDSENKYEHSSTYLHYTRQLVLTTLQFLLLVAGLAIIIFNISLKIL